MMFEFLPGVEPLEQDTDSFEALGELTARMHRHSRGTGLGRATSPASIGTTTPPSARGALPGALAGGSRGRCADEREVLGRLDATLKRRLAAYGTGRDRYGLVHA